MQQLAEVTTYLGFLGATGVRESSDGHVDFELGGCIGFGSVRAGAFHGSIWIGLSEDASVGYDEALLWSGLQVAPAGCEIEILDWESGLEVWVRFERPLAGDPQTADPLRHYLAALARAWKQRETDPVADLTFVSVG